MNFLHILQTSGMMLMWFLPTLLWQGDPLPERKDVYNGIRDPDRQASNQNSDSLIEQALRRNFSPNGILRLIMIDTVIVSTHMSDNMNC